MKKRERSQTCFKDYTKTGFKIGYVKYIVLVKEKRKKWQEKEERKEG